MLTNTANQSQNWGVSPTEVFGLALASPKPPEQVQQGHTPASHPRTSFLGFVEVVHGLNELAPLLEDLWLFFFFEQFVKLNAKHFTAGAVKVLAAGTTNATRRVS